MFCQMWSHKWWIAEDNHFPRPAGCTGINAPRCLVWLSLIVAMAHTWPTFSLMSIRPFRSFLIKLISSSVPSLYSCMALLFPRCRTFHLPSWISLWFCYPISPACSCPPECRQPCPPAYQLLPIYKITGSNIMKDIIVILMVLYKFRMEQG